MTTNDATAYPYPDEPERIGELFGEVFDLVDETVDGISDAEVDQALRQVYADEQLGELADLDELSRLLARTGWKLSRTGPAALDSAALIAWDKASCAVRAARDEVRAAQAAAATARAEAQRQLDAAAEAQQQAAAVTAGATAFVDRALDEAEAAKEAAREEAARLIEQAKQQAEEILAAAEARAAQVAQPSPRTDWQVPDVVAGPRMLVLAPPGTGKTRVISEVMARIAEAGDAAMDVACWSADLFAPLAGVDLPQVASLLEPATSAHRDIVVHHRGLVRQALAEAHSTAGYPAGSLAHATFLRYFYDDALDVDLVPALGGAGRRRLPAPGRAAGATRWAEWVQTLLTATDRWRVPIACEVMDDGGIDAVADTWIRIGERCDAGALQHLVVQVKRYHADSVTLRVPRSITLQSLLLVVGTAGEAKRPSAADVDELRSVLDELAATARTDRLALPSGRSGS